jgi:hypothetical protein
LGTDDMSKNSVKYSSERRRRAPDIIAAVLIALCIFLLGFFNLDNNCNWGDDFAAYMSDGIALAQGRYGEQIRINKILRDSVATDSAGISVHVHAWGFPLLEAAVYKLAGFDTVNFDNLYLYKLPSLFFFSIMAGVCYLFFRRRMSVLPSLILVTVLCCSLEFMDAIRNLYNDVVFMALSLISFYCAECCLDCRKSRSKILLSVLLGILLWFSYSVRLNGITIILTVLLQHIIALVREKRRPEPSDFVPYGVFLLLVIIFNVIVFPQPTSTSSLIDDFSLSHLVTGTAYYWDQLANWVHGTFFNIFAVPVYTVFNFLLPGLNVSPAVEPLTDILCWLFLIFAVIGFINDGLKRDTHLALYILLSFIGTAALNLGQDLRYLYVLLPHILAFAAGGIRWTVSAGGSFCRKKHEAPVRRKKYLMPAAAVLTAVVCLFAALPLLRADIENRRNFNREPLTAYSEEAVETYGYIRRELGRDKTIAFFKPRALYLNTGNVSMLPGRNDFKISSADYYLYYKPDPDFLLTEDIEDCFCLEFENGEFALYRNLKCNDC